MTDLESRLSRVEQENTILNIFVSSIIELLPPTAIRQFAALVMRRVEFAREKKILDDDMLASLLTRVRRILTEAPMGEED